MQTLCVHDNTEDVGVRVLLSKFAAKVHAKAPHSSRCRVMRGFVSRVSGCGIRVAPSPSDVQPMNEEGLAVCALLSKGCH